MKDLPSPPYRYPKYIFNVSWDYSSPRGRRLLALLDADDSVTKEDAFAIATDVYDVMAPAWQKALGSALEAADKATVAPESAAAVRDILAWNGEFTQDSTAATVLFFLRRKCPGKIDVKAVAEASERKLASPDNNVLQPYRELRSDA